MWKKLNIDFLFSHDVVLCVLWKLPPSISSFMLVVSDSVVGHLPLPLYRVASGLQLQWGWPNLALI